jgi:transcriptional regulator with XRE-family HTH domain
MKNHKEETLRDKIELLSSRIKNLREERGLSLTELADRAGISKSTLSLIESGKANPTISTLWAIADALEVPFGLLIDVNNIIEEDGISVRLIERLNNSEVYIMKFRPKSMRRAAPHAGGVREHVFVAGGSILVGPAESPKLVGKWETHDFRGDVPHVYVSLDDPSLAVVVVEYEVRA